MAASPIESRPLRYVVLLAVWLGFMGILWVLLGLVPDEQPLRDAGTFVAIVGMLTVWTEVHTRLASGHSRWHPRTWRSEDGGR